MAPLVSSTADHYGRPAMNNISMILIVRMHSCAGGRGLQSVFGHDRCSIQATWRRLRSHRIVARGYRMRCLVRHTRARCGWWVLNLDKRRQRRDHRFSYPRVMSNDAFVHLLQIDDCRLLLYLLLYNIDFLQRCAFASFHVPDTRDRGLIVLVAIQKKFRHSQASFNRPLTVRLAQTVIHITS